MAWMKLEIPLDGTHFILNVDTVEQFRIEDDGKNFYLYAITKKGEKIVIDSGDGENFPDYLGACLERIYSLLTQGNNTIDMTVEVRWPIYSSIQEHNSNPMTINSKPTIISQ